MEPENKPKTSPKDIFLNLGAIVALYTVTISLLNLLFSVINSAFPQVANGYGYYGSQSISWPVSVLVIFFPIFILLMWMLERGYVSEPERKRMGIRKWLTYITLFITGILLAGDFVTIIYYFIDGTELTTGFILKFLSVLVISFGIFYYYISDVREKLTAKSQKIWLIISTIIIVAAIAWGFSVLGSPRTQKLHKYDNIKLSDVMNISNQVDEYFGRTGNLPESLSDLATSGNYFTVPVDPQSNASYEYKVKNHTMYSICAEFNFPRSNVDAMKDPYTYYGMSGGWTHVAGRVCFDRTTPPSQIPTPLQVK